ncbi:TPA: hypothetical protein QCX52_005663, partial [Bacillus toyonensis]|nr:hypothetical protein [Bacillus toyonensis]
EEIQAEHDKEMKERQLKIEEEKNRIEVEALNLQQRKEEAKEVRSNDREQKLLNIIEDLKEKLLKAHANPEQQPLQQPVMMYPQPVQQPVYMYQQPVQQAPIQPQQPVMQQQTKTSTKKRRTFLARLMDSE